ncbi:ArsR family transcriptional regulator [Nonomuraea sp. NBC_01738]|uniref:ArsR/SmtB family transcription factor n=1 Tax=Nonomuraea sp. NBC_01738 TaxID=2976003 RepID=UPI002E13E16A|nr:ArsR family transcriptional regulator [Nonomuraea sp. NBC_01738]
MRQLPHPATEDIQLTEVLRALADPVRLELVRKLGDGIELACSTAGDDLDVHKSTLSHHYRTLRESGVTHTRIDGRQRLLSLRRDDLDARFPGLLDSIITAADRVGV